MPIFNKGAVGRAFESVKRNIRELPQSVMSLFGPRRYTDTSAGQPASRPTPMPVQAPQVQAQETLPESEIRQMRRTVTPAERYQELNTIQDVRESYPGLPEQVLLEEMRRRQEEVDKIFNNQRTTGEVLGAGTRAPMAMRKTNRLPMQNNILDLLFPFSIQDLKERVRRYTS